MWENLTKQHQRSLISLHGGGAKDLLLVGDCGGRVGTHRLLLALRSPLVADLLLDAGDVGADEEVEGSDVGLQHPHHEEHLQQ